MFFFSYWGLSRCLRFSTREFSCIIFAQSEFSSWKHKTLLLREKSYVPDILFKNYYREASGILDISILATDSWDAFARSPFLSIFCWVLLHGNSFKLSSISNSSIDYHGNSSCEGTIVLFTDTLFSDIYFARGIWYWLHIRLDCWKCTVQVATVLWILSAVFRYLTDLWIISKSWPIIT